MQQIISIYLLKTIIISGLLMLYYSLALRNKRFHYYNRFYLLSVLILSVVLPLINVQLFTLNSSNDTAINLLNVIYADAEKDGIVSTQNFELNWQVYTAIICFAVSIALLLLLAVRIIKLYRIKKKFPVHVMQDFDFISTDLQQAPFSFLKNIFWRNDISLEETSGRLILQHEITHVQEKHTWDKLFVQLMRTIFWMNPFYYFIQKELFLIHEFIADDKAVADKDAAAFAEMLLRTKYGNYSFSPANHFSYSPIKRRLLMLTTSKKPSFSYVRRVMALPLLACTVLLFAFRVQKENSTNTAMQTANTTFTIIVDAGHGGTDAGAIGIDGMKEKDLTLKLAKKIKDLSAGYGINVILTRDADATMTPKERTDFVDKNKADAFVSVHLDASDYNRIIGKGVSGMEVLVSKDNAHFSESKLLGSAMVQKLSEGFSVNQNLIEPKTGVWVLKANSLPAVLIEFGFIDNKADAALLTNDAKLDVMAKNVLEAVAAYSNNIGVTTGDYNIRPLDNYVSVATVSRADTPLYIIDGKEVNAAVAKGLDKNKIESVNVWKGKEAIDKYGDKGRNGVVEITTKSAVENNPVPDSVLYVVDGQIISKNDVKNIPPQDIESMSVLKGEPAIKKYGEKGKNGVIEITTKNPVKKENGLINKNPKQNSGLLFGIFTCDEDC